MSVDRRDWLLLLLGLPEPIPLDPVRVQKAMFLFAHEGPAPAAELYEFEPYDYGPFSGEIYRDLDRLVATGLVERIDTPGYTWKRFQASAAGQGEIHRIRARLSSDEHRGLASLLELKRLVMALEFRALLQHVYRRYPEFAENSVFA